MPDPQDYEYSGRRSKYPPVLQLLGYFGLGIGAILLAFDRLDQFTAFEKSVRMNGLQPTMRVYWLEKFLYDLGGKQLVFGFGLVTGLVLIGAGVWRLRDWLRLRNGH